MSRQAHQERAPSPCRQARRDHRLFWLGPTPEDKRVVYAELGVNLTYHPDETVLAKADAPHVDACTNECVGGPTPTLTTRPASLTKVYLVAA